MRVSCKLDMRGSPILMHPECLVHLTKDQHAYGQKLVPGRAPLAAAGCEAGAVAWCETQRRQAGVSDTMVQCSGPSRSGPGVSLGPD